MKKSFTLVEVLFSIVIFSIALLSISNLMSQQISASKSAANNLIAAYLAQEGIEIIKNLRDKAFLQNQNWDSYIAPNINNISDNRLDYTSQRFPDTNLPNCTYLRLNSNGLYNCSSGTQTPFSRTISITKEITNEGEKRMRVRVEIRWRERGITQYFTLSTYLYDWKP